MCLTILLIPKVDFAGMCIKCTIKQLAFIMLCIAGALYGSGRADSACVYQVLLKRNNIIIPICLDSYTPVDDSCSQLRIGTEELPGIYFILTCSFDRAWHYKGLASESAPEGDRFDVLIINDLNGNFSRLAVTILPSSDTAYTSSPKLNSQHDNKIQESDNVQKSSISIEQANFICEERTVRIVRVEREFTYPGGYMRRGQELNYPQLKMFHYGSSVRSLSQESLLDILNDQYYHILHHKKPKYD